MKKIVIYILSLLIGALIGGGAVAGLILMLEGREGMADLISKMSEVAAIDFVAPVVLAFVALFVAIFLHIILHEGGHLIMGYATGYRFVSFRIASIAFIRKDGRIKIKRFKLAGTGGQCLMSPPDVALDQAPYFWYNAGGVLMNLVFALLPLVLLMTYSMPMWLEELCMMMTFVGAFLALVNGIPMRPGGMQNDGMNILTIYRIPEKRKDFVRQLQIAAAATEGKRASEMPSEWFDCDPIDDYKDFLRLASRINYLARLIDEGRFMDAHASVEDIMPHYAELPQLAQRELTGEYVFTELLTEGRIEVVEEYWTKQLADYIKAGARFSSSKQRILLAHALYAEKDTDKALHLYNETLAHKDDYLIEGEARGDLALMKEILDNYNALCSTSGTSANITDL